MGMLQPFLWIPLITHGIFTLLYTVLHISAIILKNPWMTLVWGFLAVSKCYFEMAMIIYLSIIIPLFSIEQYWWLAITFIFQSLNSLGTLFMTTKDTQNYNPKCTVYAGEIISNVAVTESEKNSPSIPNGGDHDHA